MSAGNSAFSVESRKSVWPGGIDWPTKFAMLRCSRGGLSDCTPFASKEDFAMVTHCWVAGEK